jgi:hypothetical protein
VIRDPDALRTVWLFGKPYSWGRLPDRRLTLEPAVLSTERPVTNLADAVMTMLAGPLPWPPKENPRA